MTREEAIKVLKDISKAYRRFTKDEIIALESAIQALEQELFINKPCVSSGVCEHDKNKVLDKIKAEIELAKKQGFQRNRKTYDECISIIDKHIGEEE